MSDVKENLSIPIEYFVADEWGIQDEVSCVADDHLREFGGEELLLSRMSSTERRLWRPSRLSLDAGIMEDKYEQPLLVLVATRETPRGNIGKLGIYTTIGRRVTGGKLWVEPICSSNDLAYTANALVAWRETLAA